MATFNYYNSIYNSKAAKEIVPYLVNTFNPKSVIDFGCGTGSWLEVFSEYIGEDIIGIDGASLNQTQLKIPVSKFLSWNFEESINLERRFDIVLSLEVAEHIKEEYSDNFIETLIKHGDIIIFSAAIPFQGGVEHVNEQWPAYWSKKFEKFNYKAYDIIRYKFWNNHQVNEWYKQNIIVYIKEGLGVNYDLKSPFTEVLSLVHPDLFEYKMMIFNKCINDFKTGNISLSLGFLILFRTFLHYLDKVKRRIKRISSLIVLTK